MKFHLAILLKFIGTQLMALGDKLCTLSESLDKKG